MKMRNRLLLFVTALLCFCLSAYSQANEGETPSRPYFSPHLRFGVTLNVDANGLHGGRYRESEVPDKPAFGGSLVAKLHAGEATDVFNFSIGLGYRGFWDQAPPHEFVRHSTFSDYLLYSRNHSDNRDGSEVRPLGGQLVIPAEAHINLVRMGDEGSFFIGGGLEYGLRVYQSKRYANYFGAHIMNVASLSYQPMIGIKADLEDFGFMLSLYYKRYIYNAFNTKDIPIDKFNRGYLGIQLSIVLGE